MLVTVLGWFVDWFARSPMTIGERKAFLRGLGSDLVSLPGRLRRLAADPRTPRRARWLLTALAVYVASPIVPITPNVLARVRRVIPPEVWETHFPAWSMPRTSGEDQSASNAPATKAMTAAWISSLSNAGPPWGASGITIRVCSTPTSASAASSSRLWLSGTTWSSSP